MMSDIWKETGLRRGQIETLDFVAFSFQFRGEKYYLVLKSRMGFRGVQLADWVDARMKEFTDSCVENNQRRTIRSKIIETDYMELRLNGMIDKGYFK